MAAFLRRCAVGFGAAVMTLLMALPLRALEPDQLEAFLQVTGFDVALESIRLSAGSAPDMIGIQAEDFGSEWTRLVDDVFDEAMMHDMALEILGAAMTEDMLHHAVEFYASDLGLRLVAAENASHLVEDDALKSDSGAQIIDGLVRAGSPRMELLKRLNAATNSTDASLYAVQEVQVRFLMAAASAGVVELTMDETELRAALKSQEADVRRTMQASAMKNSAYTYQAFSDAEIEAYAVALEDPLMQTVYELMNAVQFEIMANRFEAVALRMQQLRPSQDL